MLTTVNDLWPAFIDTLWYKLLINLFCVWWNHCFRCTGTSAVLSISWYWCKIDINHDFKSDLLNSYSLIIHKKPHSLTVYFEILHWGKKWIKKNSYLSYLHTNSFCILRLLRKTVAVYVVWFYKFKSSYWLPWSILYIFFFVDSWKC